MKWNFACVAALVGVLPVATLAREDIPHCVPDESSTGLTGATMLQERQKRQQVDARMRTQRTHVAFVQNPVPMPGREMAEVDTTGMVKRTSGELTFFTHPQDAFVSASITPTGYWDKEKSDELCKEYGIWPDGKADFLDVGANIGTWSIPMARCLQRLNRGGSVIAVEALGLNAKHLAASAHANSLHNINLYNYAVGEGGPKDQAAEWVDAHNKGGSAIVDPSVPEAVFLEPLDDASVPIVETSDTLDLFLADRLARKYGYVVTDGGPQDLAAELVNSDRTELVSMTTLDAILGKDSRIFAMKMDIEYYELYALQGAPNLLSADHRPCIIYIELRVDSHEPSAKAMKLLEDSGYQRIEALSSSDRENHVMHHKDFAACTERFASA